MVYTCLVEELGLGQSTGPMFSSSFPVHRRTPLGWDRHPVTTTLAEAGAWHRWSTRGIVDTGLYSVVIGFLVSMLIGGGLAPRPI